MTTKVIRFIGLSLVLLLILTSLVLCQIETNGLKYSPLPDGTYGVAAGTARNLEKIVIPASYNGKAVTAILPEAFEKATNLKSVTIPDSITRIGNRAFYGCNSLTNISIPDSVTTIGEYAFHGCSSLANITIPDSVTSIGFSSFDNCSRLTSVTFDHTDGWWVSPSSISTNGTTIAATDLADPTTAATYLTSTYLNYYWKRN